MHNSAMIVQMCAESYVRYLLGQTRLYKWLRWNLIVNKTILTWVVLLGYSVNGLTFFFPGLWQMVSELT